MTKDNASWPEDALEQISVSVAFDAMHHFIAAYIERGEHKEDALLNLASWSLREPGGRPADPAFWADWLVALESASQQRSPLN
jgi:hypothetical protein